MPFARAHLIITPRYKAECLRIVFVNLQNDCVTLSYGTQKNVRKLSLQFGFVPHVSSFINILHLW